MCWGVVKLAGKVIYRGISDTLGLTHTLRSGLQSFIGRPSLKCHTILKYCWVQDKFLCVEAVLISECPLSQIPSYPQVRGGWWG